MPFSVEKIELIRPPQGIGITGPWKDGQEGAEAAIRAYLKAAGAVKKEGHRGPSTPAITAAVESAARRSVPMSVVESVLLQLGYTRTGSTWDIVFERQVRKES